MSVFGKIGGALKHIVVAVGHGFVALFGKEQAQNFAKAAFDILKTEAGQIVLSVVENLEGLTPQPSGSDKNAQAFSAIKSAFVKSGIEAKDSYINLLIEVAVSFVKGTFSLLEAKTPSGSSSSGGSQTPDPNPPASPAVESSLPGSAQTN